ncbi:MAG: fused MFS/spermidine synthase [Candidatus Rokubacteria bacterium]|nr:fused MFS/spermidine synthase [Candidatus Rokubacteria bacterium]
MSAAWLALFFFVSGFCSLVYEVVWLRLAMAAFGVNTPLVAIVLSVFMAGLAIGSWGGGRLVVAADPGRALRLYAAAELVIGLSGIAVPYALGWGRGVLARAAETAAWGSGSYYAASGAFVALALLPSCACMGATFPLAMAALRGASRVEGAFSYLYLTNVLGATTGTLLSAVVLIELYGFRGTLAIAAALNAGLTAAAFALSRRLGAAASERALAPPASVIGGGGAAALLLLFTTGLTSLAAEVVWVRQFTPYLGTAVYAFALTLALYLGATFAGSRAYRARLASSAPVAWAVLGVLALLPLAVADPRPGIEAGFLWGALRLAVGIVPFCAVLGYVTPMLVDRWAVGDPGRAGAAYAVNVVGGILGPLLAAFVLLPLVGERATLAVLALPLFLAGWWSARGSRRARLALASAALLAVVLIAGTRDYFHAFPRREVRRDYTATVLATGEGADRGLLVNGIGMTRLLPVLKVMAHLPLASLGRPPESALAICFGMGTTFRSLLSWNVDVTAVELVPSVPRLFGYYHADAPALLRSPRAHVVIDDGRRFLERSRARYDVITVDPPPPVDGAGASLLYSREFYEVLKPRLKPGGILHQWLPNQESYYAIESYPTTQAAIARTIREAFPHLRVFVARDGLGIHFLASQEAVPRRTAAELAARLPAAAASDLVEWGPDRSAEAQLADVLRRETTADAFVRLVAEAPQLVDDHPINEYFLLRRTFRPDFHVHDEDFRREDPPALRAALSSRGWGSTAQGLTLAPGGSGEMIYRFDTRRGVKAARLLLWLRPPAGVRTWVEVATDKESWITVGHDAEYGGTSIDVTGIVARQPQFFVRLRAVYPTGERPALVVERFKVEYAE